MSGKPNGDNLVVTDYQNGIAMKESVISPSERVVKSTAINPNFESLRASIGTSIGYITYKTDPITSENLRIRVYSLLTDNDLESYAINGKTTNTLAIITGVVASIISIFVPQATIGSTIISSVGGSAAGGAIGVVFSEPVAVGAYYDS